MADTRPLIDICREIRQTWRKKDGTANVWFGAAPYLSAMEDIARSGDDFNAYGLDSAKYIVVYFLANAAQFKGEAAKRIKAELRQKYDI